MSEVIFTKQAGVNTPSTGKVSLYTKTDGRFYLKDDTGAEFPVVFPASTDNLTNKTLVGTKEARVALTGTSIDLAAGNVFTKTISGATTLSVVNVPAAGTAGSFMLDLTNGGSATIAWWSGMKWSGGTAPALTAAGRDMLGFVTHDGGTTWNGFVLGKDVK